MAEAKYLVKVYEAEKAMRVSGEVLELVKTAVGGRMAQRMKKEYVECPVSGRRTPFLECFLCVSFIRRVMGEVHCRGERFEIRK